MNGVALAYAQARLQARLARLPTEAQWPTLAGIAEFPAWLEQARTTVLQPWLAGLGARAEAHEIERVLRHHLRVASDEIARWLPPPLQPALRWCAVLADLPALDHLLRGGAPLPWMREEEALRPLLDVEPAAARRAALARTGLAALARALDADATLLDAWLAEFRARLPGTDPGIETLIAVVAEHRLGFAPPAEPTRGLAAAWDARRRLREQVLRQFRRAFQRPAAAFAYLLLLALDLERLRAALLRRAAFPPPPAPGGR